MNESDGTPTPAGNSSGIAADALIEPTLVGAMGRDVTSGKLTPEGMSKPYPAGQWELVPEELRSFITSQKMSDLADALRASPILYWHPIVAHQIVHLQRLATDLGYEPGDLADCAQAALQQLLTIHAESLAWGQRVSWKSKPKRTGPKGTISNPHPSGVPDSESVWPFQLHAAWETVRATFRSSKVPWTRKPTENTEAYRTRIAARVQTLMARVPIEWSNLWSLTASAQHDAEGEPLSPYDVPLSTLEHSIQWNTNFGPAINAALDSEAALVAKDGVPATLAHFILAHLLSDSEHAISGEQVREKIDRYRRKPTPKTAKPSK